jgi:hypothetical protein
MSMNKHRKACANQIVYTKPVIKLSSFDEFHFLSGARARVREPDWFSVTIPATRKVTMQHWLDE